MNSNEWKSFSSWTRSPHVNVLLLSSWFHFTFALHYKAYNISCVESSVNGAAKTGRRYNDPETQSLHQYHHPGFFVIQTKWRSIITLPAVESLHILFHKNRDFRVSIQRSITRNFHHALLYNMMSPKSLRTDFINAHHTSLEAGKIKGKWDY